MSRPYLLVVAVAWLAAAALLFWLAPGLAAAYLVASGWIAVGGLAVWALVRWPPFKRTVATHRENARRRRDDAPAPLTADPSVTAPSRTSARRRSRTRRPSAA